MNNKGAEQSGRMHRLVCAFVVCTSRRLVSHQGPYRLDHAGFWDIHRSWWTTILHAKFKGPVKQKIQRKIVNMSLSIILNMCFGCSKELSHRDGSFEYPQHMFWLRNKTLIFSYTLLSGGLKLWFCSISSWSSLLARVPINVQGHIS